MLICLKQRCGCFHHRLLECIERRLNDEVLLILQTEEILRKVADASGKTLLHYAAQCGNTAVVRYLIGSKCDINAQDSSGVTPLMLVVESANELLVGMMLYNKADIYITDTNGVTALQRSFYNTVDTLKADYVIRLFRHYPFEVRKNHRHILQMFICTINKGFWSNKEATSSAVLNANIIVKLAVVAFCNTKLASIILQNDCTIELREPKLGLTALHCAGILGKYDNAKLLIARGANVEAANKDGVTPTMLAVQNGNVALVKKLVRHNADIFVTDSRGINAFHRSFYVNVNFAKLPTSKIWNTRFEERENHRIILEIIINKINKDFCTDKITTLKLLSTADCTIKLAVVAFCSVELALSLLQNGYIVEYREPKLGLTALHCASILAKLKNVKLLIERGANIDAIDKDRFTPLMFAVKTGYVEVAEILLKNNANVFETDNDGVSALQRSLYISLNLYESAVIIDLEMKRMQRAILKMIVNKVNKDFLADKEATAKVLLDANCVVKFAVVATFSIKLASFILKNDYRIDCHQTKLGFTALHCAIFLGKLKNAKLLIKSGANIDALDEDRYSPLHYYTHHLQYVDKKCDVLKTFLERSTNLYVPDNYTTTDIKYLLQTGTKETVRTVLQSGIDIVPGLKSLPLQHVLLGNKHLEVKDIIELGITIDANQINPLSNYSALMTEVLRGNISKIEYLLEHGANVDYTIKVAKDGEDSAIGRATMWFSKDADNITELLLRFGAGRRTTLILSLIDSLLQRKQRRIIKPIIEYFAMLAAINESAALGAICNRFNKIDSDTASMKFYFDMCVRELNELKHIVLYGEVTLFDLLHESEDTLVVYARIPEFIVAFQTTMENVPHLQPCYVKTLHRRVTKAITQVTLDEKVCRITGASTERC